MLLVKHRYYGYIGVVELITKSDPVIRIVYCMNISNTAALSSFTSHAWLAFIAINKSLVHLSSQFVLVLLKLYKAA